MYTGNFYVWSRWCSDIRWLQLCWADDTGIENLIHGFDMKSLEKCHSSRPWTQHGHVFNWENFHPHLHSTFVLSTFVQTFNIQIKGSLPMKTCWNIEEWLWACAGERHWTHLQVWPLYHTRDNKRLRRESLSFHCFWLFNWELHLLRKPRSF